MEFDLDAVVDVINGWSAIKSGWQGFIVYLPAKDQFIELLSTVPDVRGNSQDEAIEVDARYVESTYGVSSEEIMKLRSAPAEWSFIKKR
ncbi:hypothetical protein [Novosphingobium sp.]|uniref:hypothetical protein n=1 Tax=Novosphingobium sp. TaxID=1874826 RepID=UPI00333E69AF